MQDEEKPVTTWRYSFPNIVWEGWAIIFLDSTGCLAVLSDYGDYAHHWSLPKDMDARLFLLQCHDEYILRKLGQGRKEYDRDASLLAVKEGILEARRSKDFTKQAARAEWNLLYAYDDLSCDFQFQSWAEVSDLGSTSEYYVECYSAGLQAFIRGTLPRLREAIKNELKL